MNHRLSAINIGNFKTFAETQHIPFKPITLIFGSNSFGKPSIIHGLVFPYETLLGRKNLIALNLMSTKHMSEENLSI